MSLRNMFSAVSALNQAPLDRGPLARRDDARQQIVGKDALGALIVAVDRERHALMQEGAVGILLPLPQVSGRELEQPAIQRLVRRRVPRPTHRTSRRSSGRARIRQRDRRRREAHCSDASMRMVWQVTVARNVMNINVGQAR